MSTYILIDTKREPDGDQIRAAREKLWQIHNQIQGAELLLSGIGNLRSRVIMVAAGSRRGSDLVMLDNCAAASSATGEAIRHLQLEFERASWVTVTVHITETWEVTTYTYDDKGRCTITVEYETVQRDEYVTMHISLEDAW